MSDDQSGTPEHVGPEENRQRPYVNADGNVVWPSPHATPPKNPWPYPPVPADVMAQFKGNDEVPETESDEPLEEHTKAELREIAESEGVDVPSSARKDEIIEAIEEHEKG